MKLKIIILAAILAAALPLAACNSTAVDAPTETSETTTSETKVEEPPVSQPPKTDRITYAEDAMPVNTPENQEYLDKYVIPYAVTGIFSENFAPEDFSALDKRLLTIFNAFALTNPNNTLSLTDEDTEVPQDVVENALMAHLDLTPEYIRAACAEYYDPEKQVYTYAFGLGGGPAEFVVTDSSLAENTLTLFYDFYTGDYENPSDVFHYVLASKGELKITVDGDNFKYISNTVKTVPV